MSIFRFKVWWTTLWVGSNGRDLEKETQIILLDKSDSCRPYVMMLLILEGPFRASMQPGHDDNIDVCVTGACVLVWSQPRLTQTTSSGRVAKTPFPSKKHKISSCITTRPKRLVLSEFSENVELSLEPFSFELITVSPVTVLPGKSVKFAPIGLGNMLNTGGAIQSLAFDENQNSVEVGARGSGELKAFASEKPTACRVDGKQVDFEYHEGMVVIHVPWPGSSTMSVVQYIFCSTYSEHDGITVIFCFFWCEGVFYFPSRPLIMFFFCLTKGITK
ncbi:hypothetical protein L6164_008940 [Bauhinia variegata]|uniref:Uncharacterized protein n=1 Tax=Bauhinia variegata TaxID=167791 RepID=A0ACB9PIB4_BAUVA|nr:hypothetical protein L6164_008940 [Bauhinia variegata]